MAPIQQIGSRLVKTFANGKTIVTETVGKGQTLTKVLGSDGKVLTERLKVVSDPVKVGKRNVIHTERIARFSGGGIRKSAMDRVYDVTAEGKNAFAGSREVLSWPSALQNSIEKRIKLPNGKLYITNISDNIRHRECLSLNTDVQRIRGDHLIDFEYTDDFYRTFNEKGLHKSSMLDIDKHAASSMLEMRKALQAEFPGTAYTNWPGMESLNESVLPKSSLFDFLG